MPGPQDPARPSRRQIVLPHVDAVGASTARARSARSLTMKSAPASRQRRRESARQGQEIGERHGLVAELDQPAAAPEHGVE